MTNKITRSTGVALGIVGAVVAVSFFAGSTLSADRTRGDLSIEWLKQKTQSNSKAITEIRTDVTWIRATMEAEEKTARRGGKVAGVNPSGAGG